ncbi:MAG: RNA-directed DNA polymerase [Lachnospiraceae bacterium]|nr:RNA-directed DNA polymerase [Lachnospiraceae bacterium]
MILYSYEYFLHKVLESDQEELEKAKAQKPQVCSEIKLPKQSGFRRIVSVESGCELEKLQKKLQRNFLSKLPVCPSAKGFVRGSSYLNFLEEHIGHEYFLRMDLKNFFDSISVELLEESLKSFVREGEETDSGEEKKESGEGENESGILDEITALCTWKGTVPQGFLTSPSVSNLVFCRLDQRIRKYCRAYQKEQKREIFYTRYADDLLFSSLGFNFRENKNFKRMISHILADGGFCCNEKKTIYQKGNISLSGYVIQEDVHLSRKKLKNINEVICQFDKRIKFEKESDAAQKREELERKPAAAKKREEPEGKSNAAEKSVFAGKFEVDKNRNVKEILQNLNQKNMKKSDGTKISFENVESLAHYVAGYRSFLIQLARVEHGNTDYDRKIHRKIQNLEKILEHLSGILGET